MRIVDIRETAGPVKTSLCESCLDTFGTFSGIAEDAEVVDVYIALNDDTGVGFERQRELYKIMADLAAG